MPTRNATVDRLRGLCVLAVFMMHFAMLTGLDLDFLHYGTGNGYYGVVAFFSISGFLITSKLLASEKVGLSTLLNFYRFRLGRIAPNLCMLIAFLSAMSLSGITGFAMRNGISVPMLIGSALTLRFNTLYKQGANVIYCWAPLWSLMVEEIFYLGFPLVLIFSRRVGLVFTLMLTFCVMGPLYRHCCPGACYDFAGCFDDIAWA